MKAQDLFENYGKFPAINIQKMEKIASEILGWECKLVSAEKQHVCIYCGELITDFNVKKYRICSRCYNSMYNKNYYKEHEEYFREKNKERYSKDPETQRERNRENSKKYEGLFLYKLFLDNELVYIGSTTSQYIRIRNHINQEKKNFDTLTYVNFSNSNINYGELRWLEHKLIRDFKPKYNNYTNVKTELTEERQKELLDIEMKEEYIEFDLNNTKKGKGA